MIKYTNFKYFYPPRPKNAIPPSDLGFWDNNTLLSQPKLNGSNCVLFTNGIDFHTMNRHGQRLTNFRIEKTELSKTYRGDNEWMVLNGEYMNKSKNDKNGNVFNHKLVIFDILAYKNEYLIGETFLQRSELLEELYGNEDSEQEYLYSITDNIYRVKSFDDNLLKNFNDLSMIDMYEGLVMKRKNAKLEYGGSENNNISSQLKVRKPTKNYLY